MNKPVMTKYQPSVTEWFTAFGELEESEQFRKEDSYKVDRLETLYQTIGLPYERPIKFSTRDLMDKSPAFAKLLDERGNKLCAIRLIPQKSGLPKLRNRGLTLRACYETWFLKQKFNPDDYAAYVCPHSETLFWSTIFVVGPKLVFGEIIRGSHTQLTHGNTKETVYQFRFNFRSWQWSERDPGAIRYAQKMVSLLRVNDKHKRTTLAQTLNAHFSHDYLIGYFEAVVWPGKKVYFIDYNRVIPRYIQIPPPLPASGRVLPGGDRVTQGITVQPGVVRGNVVKVQPKTVRKVAFSPGSILVCVNTDVRYLPLMKKAGAIITDRGGMLSHAAIVSRELKVPCIVGTKIATRILKTGDRVEVDANKGIVRKLPR